MSGASTLEAHEDTAVTQGVASGPAVRSLGLLLALVLLAACVAMSLAVGTRSVPPGEVMSAVVDALRGRSAGGEVQEIVLGLRLPRTLVGLFVGAALGVSGALIQALTRNPLADPGILGVNAGAGFLVTLGIGLFGVVDVQGYVWFALAGAGAATLVVFTVGTVGRAGATPVRLMLVGVAVGALLGGISSMIGLLTPGVFDGMRFWGAGTLASRDEHVLWTTAPLIVAGLVLAGLVARSLNAVALGDELARSLGVRVVRTRIVVIIAVTLLAGAATAAAGPIGFIGLMVPHVVRWFTGPDQRWIFAYTVVCAPILLLAADVLGRVVVWPQEMQAGIITAFVGAPVLVMLARRRKLTGL
ncbi:iron chelate uptake ABC transporter family permease subunit [Rhodococcus artemisiae]|uniref:Iron chelate uptake ABC transporter family permease subunit n=1 Tax=Rhodococcus artemisiae TaxID=714159 RepID=A0ABU7LJI4_9NOCA|nr:iron chelate uptake ABC transporter family permease subunit [Rhodococcus artemisiae]MEE2061062.1 iron chelate uptake ABC transporter family permease subunit [Rhodococcus artemisiae]